MNYQGVFVTAAGYLADRPGGGQICTREYIGTLRAAGICLHLCPYGLDNRISTRVMKKLWKSSYFRTSERNLLKRVLIAVEANQADFVFLNQVQLAAIATPLRRVLPSRCKIVGLSHGLESTDLLHSLRFQYNFPTASPKPFMSRLLLGDTLLRETSYRPSLDFVLCLSPFDAELERWLGTSNVDWVPRVITPDPLNWNPYGNRIGFVGTLNHTPAIEGLILFLRCLAIVAPTDIRVRVIGGPDIVGRMLMTQFSIVDYLGPLSNDELRQEASTWNCFINPIFCLPRGCSTKLATAIGWEIPIVTTSSGHRGYTWRKGALSVAESPRGAADLALKMTDIETAREAQRQVAEVARSSPTIPIVGKKIAALLGTEKLNSETRASS